MITVTALLKKIDCEQSLKDTILMYTKENYKDTNIKISTMRVHEDTPLRSLFEWINTPEGFNFWCNLDFEFSKQLTGGTATVGMRYSAIMQISTGKFVSKVTKSSGKVYTVRNAVNSNYFIEYRHASNWMEDNNLKDSEYKIFEIYVKQKLG